jgi:hypothetical protein
VFSISVCDTLYYTLKAGKSKGKFSWNKLLKCKLSVLPGQERRGMEIILASGKIM